jgi:hypothetical protein
VAVAVIKESLSVVEKARMQKARLWTRELVGAHDVKGRWHDVIGIGGIVVVVGEAELRINGAVRAGHEANAKRIRVVHDAGNVWTWFESRVLRA